MSFPTQHPLRQSIVQVLSGLRRDCRFPGEDWDKVRPRTTCDANMSPTTYVKGFHADAENKIQGGLLRAFPNGASQKEIADFLNKIVSGLGNKSESAGPYLQEACVRLAEKLCPNHTLDLIDFGSVPEENTEHDDILVLDKGTLIEEDTPPDFNM